MNHAHLYGAQDNTKKSFDYTKTTCYAGDIHSQKGDKLMANKQHEIILNHLRKAKHLTLKQAMNDYDIQSFTKRISELRKLGYNIQSVKALHPTKNQSYTRYVLVDEHNAA
jgi:hypothetical protein